MLPAPTHTLPTPSSSYPTVWGWVPSLGQSGSHPAGVWRGEGELGTPVWESYINPSSMASLETLVCFQDVQGFSTLPTHLTWQVPGLSSHIKAICSGASPEGRGWGQWAGGRGLL